jgi:hypothetical protein
MVGKEAPENQKPEAKTPQGERFSSLFYVAAISANRHGIGCYNAKKLTPPRLYSKVGLS